MIGRLLIDECLSPELVQLAVAGGHVQSTCVRDRGRLGIQDWELVSYALESDFVLVTRNAEDFRGAGPDDPGGLLADVEIHPGLICLASDHELDLARQQQLFTVALEKMADLPDLVNQALEVHEREDGSISIILYEIPRPEPEQ